MKNLIATLTCAGVVSIGVAQKINKGEIPRAVVTAFAAKFNDVKKVTWEREDNTYEANFHLSGEETSATFDSTGNVMEVETETNMSAMPLVIKHSLLKDYPGYKIKEISKIVSAQMLTYEVELKKGAESFDLIFSEDGKQLKKVPPKNK